MRATAWASEQTLSLLDPSVDALLMTLPLSLAQHVLLHLARRRLGQLAELDVARRLVVGDPLTAERDQLRRVGVRPGPGHDERLRYLAPALVRHADHADL